VQGLALWDGMKVKKKTKFTTKRFSNHPDISLMFSCVYHWFLSGELAFLGIFVYILAKVQII